MKNFCTKLDEDAARVEITILNAGIYEFNFQKSVQGREFQLQVRLSRLTPPELYQVNTLGNILLSILLLPDLPFCVALPFASSS